MNAGFLPAVSVGLASLVAFFALNRPAQADEALPRPTQAVLDAMIPSVPSEADPSIPTRMNLWSAAEEELVRNEGYRGSFEDVYPQGRQREQKPPFIDFGHFEMGGFAGAVDFSSEFK